MPAPVLEACSVVKRFPGVVALRGVSFSLLPGEIHALCGENGAGKSTLIKLLSGIHPSGSYEGELRVDGQPAQFNSLAEAQRAGIAVIHQELALFEELSVAENIFLGNEPRTPLGLIDWDAIYARTRELLLRFKVALDPEMPVRLLGIGQKQLLEILKALSKNSRILILDEPTAALAEHEVRILMDILRDLRRASIACIYISHRLDEVFALSDRVTVLRDGASVLTCATPELGRQDLIRHMVGRQIDSLFPRRQSSTGPLLLSVENLCVSPPVTANPFLNGIQFRLHAGEVLGIGGLMGAGRSELLLHLFGLWGKRTAGSVRLGEHSLENQSPEEILQLGMALVSEDRRRYGLILEESVQFNLTLSSLRNRTRLGLIEAGADTAAARELVESLRIKAASLEIHAAKLSGGNQQKIVLGKALLTGPRVILLDEPTRGIDVGAKLEIYELINRLTAEGRAVILVSSELPELIGMSDRILMLREGRIGGQFAGHGTTQEELLAAALPQPVH
jgi:D-xylose transport system ATP-binding protein